MFTGIIKKIGKVISPAPNLMVEMDIDENIKIGNSVAHDGVCLTLIKKEGNKYYYQVIEETQKCTTFGDIKSGEMVNIETSLKASEGFDGHIVQGHCDCIGEIIDIKDEGLQKGFYIKIPVSFEKQIVKKGSIAINGISLTVADIIDENIIKIGIIPHTLEHTNLQYKKIGDKINIEFDILAKYVANLLKGYAK